MRAVGSGLQAAGRLCDCRKCHSVHRCGQAMCALLIARRGLIEHSTDPQRWRSVENEEVRRQHPGGVSLGSNERQKLELEAEVKARRAKGELDDAKYAAYVEVAILLVLITLSYITYLVPADPGPQYIPYTAPHTMLEVDQGGTHTGHAYADNKDSGLR